MIPTAVFRIMDKRLNADLGAAPPPLALDARFYEYRFSQVADWYVPGLV